MSTAQISNQSITLGIIGALFLGALVLGVSPIPASACILLCALLAFAHIFSHLTLSMPALLVLLYVLLHFVSGLAFGGFDALQQASVLGWLGNEGRVFLFFWPFLFATIYVPRNSPSFAQRLNVVIEWITWLAVLIFLIKAFTGVSTFSSHHAAGAFMATLVIYHFHRWYILRGPRNLTLLLLSLLALFATDSRTSLMAALLSLTLFFFFSRRALAFLRVLALIIPTFLAMPFFFQSQFDRIADAANMETMVGMRNSFARSFQGDGIELTTAFDASGHVAGEGNMNIAIRGYLWGRSVAEGLRSPLAGIGFGRFNDLGREFSGVQRVAYPATHAAYASPSVLTAHNTFVHSFTELGFPGLVLLILIIVTPWRQLSASKGNPVWIRVGMTNLICLSFMGLTQHSFGAPVYGLTLFAFVGISLRL